MKIRVTQRFAVAFLLILSFLMPLPGAKKVNPPHRIETILCPVFSEKPDGPTVPVDVFIPEGEVKGDLLVLPGWRFKRQRWYRETDLLSYARQHGYRAVFPEMNISLYASKYYDVTQRRIKWQPIAGGNGSGIL